MNYAELPLEVNEIDRKELTISYAIKLADVIAKEILPYVHYIKCCCSVTEPRKEIVIFDVEVERPQRIKHDIRKKERIGVIFTKPQTTIPDVLALRLDFPHVPHLNLSEYEAPKYLCLFNEDISEVMRRWTPFMYIERIRQWLKLTAIGTLHQADQPLEPIMSISAGTIILTNTVYKKIAEDVVAPINVYRISNINDPDLLLTTQALDCNTENEKIPFVATGYFSKPTTHGIIRSLPTTIAELSKVVEECGICLVKELRNTLKAWCGNKNNVAKVQVQESRLIIIIAFQKTRIESGPIEEKEVWSFLCGSTILEIGVDLGVWERFDGSIGLIHGYDNKKKGENIFVLPIKTVNAFSREAAAILSNTEVNEKCEVVLVGAGAMGSHFILNTVRGGIGCWTIVDYDRLLPHNLARHALDGYWIGHYKADSLSKLINNMVDIVDDEPVATPLVADVLKPGNHVEKLSTAFYKANIIVDASASIGVARYLSIDLCSKARRVSMFFTPSGSASVVLAEDSERLCTLDIIEMQYYREVATLDHLKKHLMVDGQQVRYGQSCRDLTSTISQDVVTLHASLATKIFKRILKNPDAFGGIWTVEPETSCVSFTPVQAMPLIRIDLGDWQVRTDNGFVSKLVSFRAAKLPNETGGVIIGAFDLQRQIIYLVDTIPSPPDSEEWPTVYIRGCKGLMSEIERIKELTAGNLAYVGEWHSHPDGAKPHPSADDMEAFSWLSNIMDLDGLPPLMVIIGDNNNLSIYVGKMVDC